jgi:ribonuclease III
VWNILTLSKSNSKEDKKLIAAIKAIAGFAPGNLEIYRLACIHRSKLRQKEGTKDSNERLEYLGDAVLGAAVADYLFKKYPFQDEGFLTEIRSRIVNRESLNNLARKIGIANIVQYDHKNTQLQKVILGNTLEALVGAVYLDKGYLKCKKFVIDKLIQPYFDLEVVVKSEPNHKSRVIEWAQRQAKEIRFEVSEVKRGRGREFCAQVFLQGEPYAIGYGLTKKKAEQDAAEKTFAILEPKKEK